MGIAKHYFYSNFKKYRDYSINYKMAVHHHCQIHRSMEINLWALQITVVQLPYFTSVLVNMSAIKSTLKACFQFKWKAMIISFYFIKFVKRWIFFFVEIKRWENTNTLLFFSKIILEFCRKFNSFTFSILLDIISGNLIIKLILNYIY